MWYFSHFFDNDFCFRFLLLIKDTPYHVKLAQLSLKNMCEWNMWSGENVKCSCLSFSIYDVENLCFDHITWRKNDYYWIFFSAHSLHNNAMFHDANEIFSFKSIYQTWRKKGWTSREQRVDCECRENMKSGLPSIHTRTAFHTKNIYAFS